MPAPPEAVGPDQVRFQGETLIVDSAVDMTDWEFRAHRRTAVVFHELRYFVSEKLLLPGGSYRYVLEPWPEDLTDLPGRTVLYDESYVARREAEARDTIRRDRVSAALFWVSPLLGFLPSRWKLALNDRYAFHPVTVTLQSLFLERVALYALGAFVIIAGVTRAFGAGLPAALGLALATALDLVLRTGPAEEGRIEQPGYWEWILPSWRRRARRF